MRPLDIEEANADVARETQIQYTYYKRDDQLNIYIHSY